MGTPRHSESLRQLKHAQGMLLRAESRAKRATRLLQCWRVKVDRLLTIHNESVQPSLWMVTSEHAVTCGSTPAQMDLLFVAQCTAEPQSQPESQETEMRRVTVKNIVAGPMQENVCEEMSA